MFDSRRDSPITRTAFWRAHAAGLQRERDDARLSLEAILALVDELEEGADARLVTIQRLARMAVLGVVVRL